MSEPDVTTEGNAEGPVPTFAVTVTGTVNGMTTSELRHALASGLGVPDEVVALKRRSLTPRRRKQNDEYQGFIRRSIRGWSQRVIEQGDTSDIPPMLDTLRDVQEAIAAAVQGLNDRGFSWQEIGDAVGQRRQHAWRRWHRTPDEEAEKEWLDHSGT